MRSRYAFRPNKPIKVTVKTRRRVADCARIRKVHRSDFTLQGHPQKCPQEIFGEEEKPQGGLGGQASLVCLPASARFDEVRTQDAPLYAFRPNKPIKVTVKTRRYKQDAKDKAFRRGAYSNVRDPRKTQSDNVLRSIYAFRSIKPQSKYVSWLPHPQPASPPIRSRYTAPISAL